MYVRSRWMILPNLTHRDVHLAFSCWSFSSCSLHPYRWWPINVQVSKTFNCSIFDPVFSFCMCPLNEWHHAYAASERDRKTFRAENGNSRSEQIKRRGGCAAWRPGDGLASVVWRAGESVRLSGGTVQYRKRMGYCCGGRKQKQLQ